MAIGARSLAASIVLAIACACSSEPDNCPSSLTKVCLPDGTTCTCSPSCTPPSDCASHKICRNDKCAQCSGETCACSSSNVCVPTSWGSGQSVTFE